jgi:hypothetical protein
VVDGVMARVDGLFEAADRSAELENIRFAAWRPRPVALLDSVRGGEPPSTWTLRTRRQETAFGQTLLLVHVFSLQWAALRVPWRWRSSWRSALPTRGVAMCGVAECQGGKKLTSHGLPVSSSDAPRPVSELSENAGMLDLARAVNLDGHS